MFNKCRSFTILFILLFFVFQSFQSEVNGKENNKFKDITGAFGIKFGTELSKLDVIGESKTTEGEPLYKINPPKKVNFWAEYYVLVTPLSKKVYAIWGISRQLSKAECESSLKAVLSILTKKYKARAEEPFFSMEETKYITKNNGKIVLRCSSTLDSNFNEVSDFYIQYISSKFKKLAEEERIKLKSKELKGEEDAL